MERKSINIGKGVRDISHHIVLRQFPFMGLEIFKDSICSRNGLMLCYPCFRGASLSPLAYSRSCFLSMQAMPTSRIFIDFLISAQSRIFVACVVNSTPVLFQSTTILLEFPVPIVQRANLACLQPARNAVEVESVLASISNWFERGQAYVHYTFPKRLCIPRWLLRLDLLDIRCLVRVSSCHQGIVSSHTEIHDMVSTNGTVVNNNIPSPQSDSVPLFDF